MYFTLNVPIALPIDLAYGFLNIIGFSLTLQSACIMILNSAKIHFPDII